MKKYLNYLKKLIKKHGKPWVAHQLSVNSTATIDNWITRESIPSKYIDLLDQLNGGEL